MYRQVQPVKRDELQPGDLLFFRISKRIRTHVAIYAGDGKFIHAPSAGKDVSYASLSDPYWRNRLVRAGRLLGKVLVGAIIPPASY
jgi:cell wall-associated NlpC family hydrolase